VPRFRRQPRPPRPHGPEPPPHDTTPRWGEPGIHGIARPREWDAVVTVDAPGVEGDEVELVLLPDGTAIPPSAQALADALAGAIEPPWRGRAVRRGRARFAVGARAIDVVELPESTAGDEIVLSWNGSERILKVDDMPAFGSLPELERLGADRHRQYVVRAVRLDRSRWEVVVSPL
jgi:hypothetical protein